MNKFFTKCNMVLRTCLEFNKSGNVIKLPFYFHIKDIKQDFSLGEIDENILEDYPSEFNEQKDSIDTIEYNISLLKYVDLKSFTISFDEEDLIEYGGKVEKCRDGYIFKNHETLYSFLVDMLVFSDIDFKQIEVFILQCQIRLKKDFEKMLIKEMDIGSQSEEPSESFMVLRCAFELNRPPLFSENKGLSISEMSWRELLTQRIYMGRKCEIEKIQYDKVMKKSNKK